MKVLLTVANFYDECNPPEWLKSNDMMGCNQLTDNPGEADIIIFVEAHHSHDPYFRNVLRHPFYRQYPQKCLLYHDADLSITTLPTITPSIEKWQYNSKNKRSFHYLERVTENHTIDQAAVNYSNDREYLYSFIGSETHPLRKKLLAITHAPDAFIMDTNGTNAWDLGKLEKIQYEQRYFEVANKSYFILAPRGIGPSTYRLFESMQLGRVPVIISDDWVKIPHIDWDQFSITIPESAIKSIPQILNERRSEAIEMGKIARKTWEAHFSPGVSLHHLIAAASELIQEPYTIKDALFDYAQFIRSPWHFKNLLRSKKNQIKNKVQSRKLSKNKQLVL